MYLTRIADSHLHLPFVIECADWLEGLVVLLKKPENMPHFMDSIKVVLPTPLAPNNFSFILDKCWGKGTS